MLLQENIPLFHDQCRNYDFPQETWNLIWKVKFPLKIITFARKILHDSLPVKKILKNRGILVPNICPLCENEDESMSHLLFYCPFARAVWHGSHLVVHMFD